MTNLYPYEYVDSVFSIDYNALYEQGIRGLIFDIDNTLVHHGDDSTLKSINYFVIFKLLVLKRCCFPIMKKSVSIVLLRISQLIIYVMLKNQKRGGI